MYNKDKTHRITLRLTEEQFEFVRENADVLGVSPSEFLRMVVNMTMSSTRKFSEKVDAATDVIARSAAETLAESDN